MFSRYGRQMILPEIGEEGQKKLLSAKVLIIGCGGLGTPCATYLAQAGIGQLDLVDADTVSFSNLNRQFFFTQKDIGAYKAEIAEKKLVQMNGALCVHGHVKHIDERTVDVILQNFDVVVDCVDNQETRKIVHRASLKLGIPLVEGGIDGFYGFISCIKKGYPCLNCMDFFAGREKEKTPVLGAVAGIIGSMQALEAIKIILGMDNALFGQILYYDAKRQEMESVSIPENETCPLHGLHKE
jgi:adenylyltransferase/sulfurtransferase